MNEVKAASQNQQMHHRERRESSWSRQKDGNISFSVDLLEANTAVVSESYPLVSVEELLNFFI